jgi:hypothetical protein
MKSEVIDIDNLSEGKIKGTPFEKLGKRCNVEWKTRHA